MKKLIYVLIAFMFVSVIPEIATAQSNDPFEQQTLKARDNSTKREKKISRKKDAEAEQAKPQAQKQQPQVQEQQPKAQPVVESNKNEMTISNSCDEWLDVEFVSLVGSRSTQMITLTIKFINHDVNKHMYVGGNFLAYDCEGNEHSRGWASASFNTVTDVPVKTKIEVPGKINPSNTKVLPVMSFKVGDCTIEMRNVPINWK